MTFSDGSGPQSSRDGLMEGVRRAGTADKEQCLSLLRHAVGDHDRALELLIDTGLDGFDRSVFLGSFDDTTVGLAVAHIDRLPAETIATMDLCYVEPEARDVGVGESLVFAVMHWARDAGATALQALAAPGDRATKRLLESAGFKTRLLILQRPVDDLAGPPPFP
jgi:N-acetylglutamate synthase-like GNAT family acetyltransferase